MTDATPEQLEMARRIAAHVLCGPERWKPGVKAGMYDDIMRGAADAEAIVQGPLRAIIETTRLSSEMAKDTLDKARSGEIDNDLRSIKHILVGRFADNDHLKGQDNDR